MRKINKLKILALVLLLSTTVACNNSNSSSQGGNSSEVSSGENQIVNVTGLEVSSSENVLKVGEKIQLNILVLPSNATNKDVDFVLSNDNVSVSSTGVVEGLKVGQTTIKVVTKDGGFEQIISLDILEGGENASLNISDYTSKLSSTPYTIDGLSGREKYGLSQSSNVGVNESLILEKYPVKSDSEIGSEYVIDVGSLSLSEIQNYISSCEAVNSYYQIQAAIFKAKEFNDLGHEAKIKLPGGMLDVDASLSPYNYAFHIEGLNGTYFEGNDTTINLLIKDLNYKGYLNVSNSKNVYFNGITLQMAKPSSLTGEIISGDVTSKTLTISVKKEFNPLIEEVLKQTNLPRIRSWVEFHHQNKVPLQGGNFVVDGFDSYTIEGDSSTEYTISVKFSSGISRPRNGTLVSLQFSQYDAYGMTFSNCENAYIENLTMHHAYGMGLTASSVTNLFINRFNLKLKENSDSLMTATADAMHFNSMHGKVQVTNSLIENSHDDALNIKHGYWYKLADKEGGSTKSMTLSKITSAVSEPKVGDKIAVYDESTFESYNPTQGYYTIKSVEKISTGYFITVNERMSNTGEWNTARVTFLSDTPEFVFANNIIRNKRNRGVLVQVPNAIIENNTFMNVGHGSIQAATAMDIYNEATMPQGITIKNNKFINNCYIKPEPLYGDISIFAISNNGTVAPSKTLHDITIENNYISNNGNAAISLRGVGSNTNVKDNLFYECSSSQPSGETFNCLFHLYNCEDIVLDGNFNKYSLDNGLSGIITEGRTTESGITINGNNTDIKFKVNTDAGPIVDVTKATGNIAIDGDISDWSSVGATNIVIDGVSDAEGTERTIEELYDHFHINSLMITYTDEGIYIGFDVFDNQIDIKTVSDFWLGDCVEIFMSSITDMPNADMQVYKDEGGVLQAAFSSRWTNNNYTAISDVRTNSTYVKNASQILANVQTTATGYVGEICIPFSFAPEFKTAIDAGNPIDIAIVVADSERSSLGLKRVQVANVPHFVESYKTKTARMPQYMFK